MASIAPDLLSRAHKTVDGWREKLLDLSPRNRLLRFQRTRLSSVPIEFPDLPELFDLLVLHDKPVTVVSAGEGEEGQLMLLPPSGGAELASRRARRNLIVSTYETDHLKSALYNLRQRGRMALEERGVNALYVALGFVIWKDPSERLEHWNAPLILAPVSLERERGASEKYTLSPLEEDVVLNPTLRHTLQLAFGIQLPELPDDLEHFDLNEYARIVESLIRALPEAAVNHEACLGLFSFLKHAMYQDLTRYAESVLEHPIVAGLAGLPVPSPEAQSGISFALDERLDECTEPRSTLQVLDADSSQQKVLLAAQRGAHLLIEGPPGTGKSQTIANLIAESLALGKRVLFVSE
ncbi:MAG: DUF4011 domain-containing protein, partial [Chloroflexi bacterium]|nr:DUF4011 domain-containing protein [Chloroflexota bacterium]